MKELFGVVVASHPVASAPNVRFVIFAWHRDGHHEAHALSRQDSLPAFNQLFVGSADWANIPVQIIKPERIDVTVVLTKCCVPIHLVRK